MPQLTELKIKSIKVSENVQRFYDSHGLYLEISKAGSKLWRFKYRYEGREKRLALGIWPDVTLKEAREKRDQARKTLQKGIDPALLKKPKPSSPHGVTFQDVAMEFMQNNSNAWSDSYATTYRARFNLYVFPHIGILQIGEVVATDIIVIIRQIEQRKAYVAARRVLGMCSMVFRYGVAIGIVQSDPCRDLKGALVPFNPGHLSAITDPKEVGGLMRSIHEYNGSEIVRCAMIFSALTFCRPGEIRHAEWTEIDFGAKEWRIPAEKMKMRHEHRVPLPKQSIEILKKIYEISQTSKYVFPAIRSFKRPMCEIAVLSAIRRMGYTKEEMTAHGFRSMASTLLNELGHRYDVIEAQLVHKGADKIRAIYNRVEYMNERRNLMQAWADYLDELTLGKH